MVNYQLGKIYCIEAINGDPNDVYIGSTTKKLLSDRYAQHKYEFKTKPNATIRSCLLFHKYGIDGCRIVLIENFPCESKNELHAREAYHIRNNQCVNKTIPLRSKKEYYNDNRENILEYQVKYRANDENKIKIQENGFRYRENNKEHIKNINRNYGIKNKIKINIKKKIYAEKKREYLVLCSKNYYIKNKVALIEKSKAYNAENKELVAERKKKHYEENKQQILQKQKLYRDDNIQEIRERKNKKVTCECGVISGTSNLTRHRKSKTHQLFIQNNNTV